MPQQQPTPDQLSDRHQQVLAATIRHYVETVEPVSSKVLVDRYDFSVSSATIRNAMGWLEKVGLLYQPYTSAGRVPSDLGYRLYVDRLTIPDATLERETDRWLERALHGDSGSVEALLHGAAQLLATLSGYVALIALPQYSARRLRHLQLVRVAADRVMAIVVTDTYDTQSVLLQLPAELVAALAEGELQVLSNFLNAKLRGRPLGDLPDLDWGELGREFQRSARVLQQAIADVLQQQPVPTTQIMVRGISEVLRQPEFTELQQVQTLLQLLESEQEQLWPLFFEVPQPAGSARRVRVRIGSENPLAPMQTCSLVTATYCRDNQPAGSVGLLGPTRMLYENAIALVEAAADYLTRSFSSTPDAPSTTAS